jgi:type VI secretion system protein ImpB
MAGTQDKVNKNRPPRVGIALDQHRDGATPQKNIPFLELIVASLSGHRINALPFKKRKCTEIDRDNKNDVFRGINPTLSYLVDNKIANDGSKLKIDLDFKCLEDLFNPLNVLKQVEPLNKLYRSRQRLQDFLTKLEGNEKLSDVIATILNNTNSLAKIKAQTEQKGG